MTLPCQAPDQLQLEDVIEGFQVRGNPSTPEEICLQINKKYGQQKYTKSDVKHMVEKHPDTFHKDRHHAKRFRITEGFVWEIPDWQLPQEEK